MPELGLQVRRRNRKQVHNDKRKYTTQKFKEMRDLINQGTLKSVMGTNKSFSKHNKERKTMFFKHNKRAPWKTEEKFEIRV